jgi:hypothetical protein
MPTRRTLELVVITVILLKPVSAMVRLWSIKTLASAPSGSIMHGAAELGSVIF